MDATKKDTKRTIFFKTEKLLLFLCDHKNIIENKKTDAVTSKQKDAILVKISHQFNATTTEATVRSAIKNVLAEPEVGVKKKLAEDKVLFISF